MTDARPRILEVRADDPPVLLPARGGRPASRHKFEARTVLAINAAIHARRPLLVRGEPGAGKSQLARAAAVAMERVFVSRVVDAHTEARDLFWTFDPVARLAEAQIQGALVHAAGAGPDGEARVRTALDERRFLRPGPLWWAFDWTSAEAQAGDAERIRCPIPRRPEGWKESHGCVVLLDEIDKADSSLPNGLLEALGEGVFEAPGHEPVAMKRGHNPLIVITTNEERELPDAFLRRCLVLHLEVPPRGESLEDWLVARGAVHFPESDEDVRRRAARLLAEDREAAAGRGLARPGQAEYLDLLRAVLAEEPEVARQRALLEQLREFALRKHPPATGRS